MGGGVPVPLPLREELDFSFSLDDLSDRLGMRTKRTSYANSRSQLEVALDRIRYFLDR